MRIKLLIAGAVVVAVALSVASGLAFSGASGGGTASATGRVVQSVSGSGHFTDAGGDPRFFSFTAERFADGSVDGQWERVNLRGDASQTKSHGKITCFTVIGNSAFLGGFATSGRLSAPPSNEVAWRVVDNGPPSVNNPPDLNSLQFIGAVPGFAAAYCAAPPATPATFIVAQGDIRVRP